MQPFNCLPVDMCHSLLLQAFKQLGQRDLYGIIPLVCQPWHQLSLECGSSLDIQVKTVAGLCSVIAWMRSHPSLVLEFRIRMLEAASSYPHSDAFLRSLAAQTQLRSLSIDGLHFGKEPLPKLSALTSLTITRAPISPMDQAAILQLSELRSLSLIQCQLGTDLGSGKTLHGSGTFGEQLIPAIASSLTRLTCLDFSDSLRDSFQDSADFSPLTALEALEALRLEGVGLGMADVAVHLPSSLPVTALSMTFPWGPQALEMGPVIRDALQPLVPRKLESLALTYYESHKPRLVVPDLFAVLAAAGPQLQSLSLKGISVHGEMNELAALTQLSQLQLVDCAVHNSAVPQLSALTGLRSLSLADNNRVQLGHSEAVVAPATTLRQLTVLSCHNEADAAVRQAFPHCIRVSRASRVTGDHTHCYTLALA